MNNYKIVHSGILGMKWGKRNGPPYPLDPEDHSAAEKKAAKENPSSEGSKWFKESVKQGKDKPSISRSEQVFKEGKKATDSANDIIRTISEIRKMNSKPRDLSKYSDKELRDAVNRMNLEKQYISLTEPELTKGEAYASKALSLTGDVLAIGASAAAIATALYAIKHSEE